MKNLFEIAVQQMRREEKTELIEMGGSVEVGAVEALKQGINAQLDKLLPRKSHARLIKP